MSGMTRYTLTYINSVSTTYQVIERFGISSVFQQNANLLADKMQLLSTFLLLPVKPVIFYGWRHWSYWKQFKFWKRRKIVPN